MFADQVSERMGIPRDQVELLLDHDYCPCCCDGTLSASFRCVRCGSDNLPLACEVYGLSIRDVLLLRS
jgi:hypothetical protein